MRQNKGVKSVKRNTYSLPSILRTVHVLCVRNNLHNTTQHNIHRHSLRIDRTCVSPRIMIMLIIIILILTLIILATATTTTITITITKSIITIITIIMIIMTIMIITIPIMILLVIMIMMILLLLLLIILLIMIMIIIICASPLLRSLWTLRVTAVCGGSSATAHADGLGFGARGYTW